MRDEIIKMARECNILEVMGYDNPHMKQWQSDVVRELEHFFHMAQAAEREKSLRLWMLLDDVDTADDIAKADDAVYRSLCRQAHAKRWSVLNGDEVDAAIRARGQS